ncbi:MAG: flagellin [Planctomycetes bacterium]|nr:flagellin [Planctomycetota bacterium]
MRIYSTDYGSAETIRIQNKTGQLFYQYLDPDSLDKKMVAADTTVQVAGDDAQISLNGAPIFTTGLIANTTTPDFSGALVFNQGTLGKTTLAVAGYDMGKYFSKATGLQGVEENEPDIQAYERSFEPPALTVSMGSGDPAAGTETGLRNAQNQPISLYMDFTQLDPTVQVKITNLGKSTDVKITYDFDSTTGVGKIKIDASRMMPPWGEDDTVDTNEYLKMHEELVQKWKDDNPGVEDEEIIQTAMDDIYQQVLDYRGELIIEEEVNISNLNDGYYVTNPNLKGLYITTSDLIDMAKSQGDEGPITMQTTPDNGDLLLEVNTYATNPRSTTSESMSDFVGGMQFQLGATEGNQDRTIYSIQSMSMSNLGRITWEGTDYCLQDVLGGGIASLTKDPILAMRVLSKAVDDVSTLRSRLGAFQSNMLQTNINSLEVAIENITKTESAIRDTDMAAESTQFTRFQIMQQAGTSMLAQANQISQNVLSLLQ